MQYKFHLNNLRIAPRKVRLIAGLIKKLSVAEAETQLMFNRKRAAVSVLKLLKSGVASAANNFSLSPDSLYVFNIFVDQGPTLKRFRARAFGRAGAIQKKTSHITLVLEEREGLAKKKRIKKTVKAAPKKEEPAMAKKEAKVAAPALPKMEAPKEIKPKRQFGSFTRKIFRRKAIS